VATTTSALAMLGRISAAMIRAVDAPMARAAAI
jgi:hypothetical protein